MSLLSDKTLGKTIVDHAADVSGVSAADHHTKYLDAEAVAAMDVKDDGNPLHHDRYTNAEADTRAALQDHDHGTPIAAHADVDDAHHVKYTDAEVDARAALQDHDHDTPIATHAALPNAHHTEAHSIASHDDTTATGAELETLTDGSNADSLHVHLETEFVVFGETGDLEVKTGTHRFYLPYDVTIIEVEISVGTAPTGAAAIVDVNVNGTTIFTTQTNRPEIAISGFVDSSVTIEDDTHTDGQYLTVDVDQIGSSVAGADLTVVVRYTK